VLGADGIKKHSRHTSRRKHFSSSAKDVDSLVADLDRAAGLGRGRGRRSSASSGPSGGGLGSRGGPTTPRGAAAAKAPGPSLTVAGISGMGSDGKRRASSTGGNRYGGGGGGSGAAPRFSRTVSADDAQHARVRTASEGDGATKKGGKGVMGLLRTMSSRGMAALKRQPSGRQVQQQQQQQQQQQEQGFGAFDDVVEEEGGGSSDEDGGGAGGGGGGCGGQAGRSSLDSLGPVPRRAGGGGEASRMRKIASTPMMKAGSARAVLPGPGAEQWGQYGGSARQRRSIIDARAKHGLQRVQAKKEVTKL
jgi:hypothetical protein